MPEGEKRPSKRTCQLAESRLPRQRKRSANLKRRTSPRIMARIRTTTQAASLRLCPWLPQVLPHAALPDETASSVFLELSTLPGQASMPVKNRLRETRIHLGCLLSTSLSAKHGKTALAVIKANGRARFGRRRLLHFCESPQPAKPI